LRNKILETAIKLFNEKGINQTSFRDIASNLEISDGHVRYYFKTKEILLMSIFKELDNEIVQGSKVENEINEITLTYLLGKIEEIFQKTVKYRFLFVESPKTLSMFPELIKSYRNLIERRKSMILGAFKVFIEKGLFDSSFDKEAQEYAFYTIFIISDGWLRTYLLTSGSEPDKQTIAFHSRLILNILRPYLKDNRL
jgi:AcrR family transcriptional regulator